MTTENINPPENKDSIFNAGISKLERIHNIKLQLIEFKKLKDYSSITELLTSFYTEMYERLTPEEIATCDKFEQNVKFITNYIMSGRRMDNKCLKKFNKFERYLSSLEYRYKMSLPNKAKDTDSVL